MLVLLGSLHTYFIFTSCSFIYHTRYPLLIIYFSIIICAIICEECDEDAGMRWGQGFPRRVLPAERPSGI
ncbi:hypothetical protein BDN70DRAFT_49015 [Pholiota conissans]|uniref:Uncharacterized protein n=1 Tax=Pholiota conissans TaxID=109636 RepID=A0A9P6CZH0_9AGAR|nr:hypothetical protein BDN70DRAFT_49015 [Pholiota conissans]